MRLRPDAVKPEAREGSADKLLLMAGGSAPSRATPEPPRASQASLTWGQDNPEPKGEVPVGRVVAEVEAER